MLGNTEPQSVGNGGGQQDSLDVDFAAANNDFAALLHPAYGSSEPAPEQAAEGSAPRRSSQRASQNRMSAVVAPPAASATGAAQTANMFADADAMRDKLHENIDKKDYDVTDFYHETGVFQSIAKSNKFMSATLVVISLNAVWIGLDVECNDPKSLEDVPGCPYQNNDEDFWAAGEHAFCFFFTFELVVRFMAFKSKWSALKDNWFKFDSVLVFFMVFETWVLPVATGGSGDALSDFALLRMLRLLRLTRMVRLMRSVPELMTLMKGMAIASRSVSSILLLLLIFMYIFAIIFKSQLVDTKVPKLKALFSGIGQSMWTLLLSGCLLDSISTVANLLVEEGVLMTITFIVFVLLSSLMILNMLIGVLCSVVTAVAAAEKEKSLVSFVKTKLIVVLETLDEDGNGTISKSEFDELVNVPDALSALDELGVDVPNLVSLSDHLFAGDDDDNAKVGPRSSAGGGQAIADGDESDEGPTMSFAEFLEMCIRLRADNVPSVLDIVELRKLIAKGQKQVSTRFHQIEKYQHELQRVINVICEQLDSALMLCMLQQDGQGQISSPSAVELSVRDQAFLDHMRRVSGGGAKHPVYEPDDAASSGEPARHEL